MEKKDYLAQFDNINDYMESVERDWLDEMGEPIPMDMRLTAYMIGLEYFDPERYERIFCS